MRSALCVLGAGVLVAGAAAQQPYRVLDQWKVGGTGGWDYLLADAAAHRLYVTHGPRVEVLDSTTGKVVGAITGLKGTHGVALDPDGKTGYISDGGANAVVVFDRTTFNVLATIAAGTNPDGIVYEPVTKTVWAFNGRSKDVSVIDTASRTVVATIALPGKPEFPQADGKGSVFDNIEDKNEIVRLDAHTNKVTAMWPVMGCDSPSGLAIDPEHERLFAVCDGGKMAVVSAESGKVLGLSAIGNGPDAAGFDPARQLAFSSNGEGTLSVVDTKPGFATLETLPTRKGGRTMAYDEKADRVYVSVAEYGPVPAATATTPRPRPTVVPDSFSILVIGR